MYFFLLILLTANLYAHQSSMTSTGSEIYWGNTSIPIALRASTPDMGSNTVTSIVQSSFDQWNSKSRVKLKLVPESQNEIRFMSNFPFGNGVVGVTEVSYNQAGAITKAVVSLNDQFFFRSTEGFYESPQVFLGDVVTHELGHLLGLSHSEVLNASMFYANFSGQSTLSLDDITGIRQKYETSYGKISGEVKGGDHVGVMGVHVQAISRATGEVSAVVTNEFGHFELGGLNLNDTYYIFTSPIKNSSSLPHYFSTIKSDFCPASYVGSFFSPCGKDHDGKPTGITLTAQQREVNVGTISINCSLRSDSNYVAEKLKSTFSSLTVYDFSAESKYEKSFVGWFFTPITADWSKEETLKIDLTSFSELGGNPKFLKVSLISYPFGSQLQYEMRIKQNGFYVLSADRGLIGPSMSGTYNPDLEAILPLNYNEEINVFEVILKAKQLAPSVLKKTFPAVDEFTTNKHLPYLLVASLWESTSEGFVPLLDSSASNLSDNEACLDAPFTYAVEKARAVKEDSGGNRDQSLVAAGCGTIGPSDSGPTSSLPLLCLGFILVSILSSFIKSRKNFLS